MGSSDRDAARAVKILNHPLRIKIIETLGASGPLSWKDLSGALGTSTGSLYHHLDMLERLVARDDSKRYMLTKAGLELYTSLKQNPNGSPYVIAKAVQRRSVGPFILDLFFPRTIIHVFASSGRRALVSSAVVLVCVLAAMGISQLQPLLLSVSASPSTLQSGIALVASVSVLMAGIYLASSRANARPSPAVLLLVVSASFVPLAFFALALNGFEALGNSPLTWGVNQLTVTFVLFQGWSMGALGAGISVATGIRIEKAVVWSLLILYASVILMLATGVRFV